jgi:ectoine hydroxylase-related dioxygenase (phytanoyl-CoA dioxygenase family)
MITTSPEEIDLDKVINQQQKNQFLEDGYIRLDQVIDADELLWYSKFYDRVFHEAPGTARKNLGGTDAQGRDLLPQVLSPSKSHPELKETRYLKRLLAIARFILGPEAAFSHDHMILKPGGYGTITPWHQDQSYHDPAYRYTTINFWLPIEDATTENGCMHYVRGSHRAGLVLPHRYLIEGDRKAALVALGEDYWDANGIAVPCPAGSVTLHHSYALHYAGPNRTDKARRAYIAAFSLPPRKLEHPFHLPWLG